MFGKKRTEDERRAIGEGRKGKYWIINPITEETKFVSSVDHEEKYFYWLKGRKLPNERIIESIRCHLTYQTNGSSS
jgi:hypothetical protein